MRPLLMVHGISSNARKTFGVPGRLFRKVRAKSMCWFLESLGYRPGYDLFWYSYRTLMPIPASARQLKKEIVRVREITGSREVDLLTFSLGGIIAKFYAVSSLYGNEIKRMIMIAPPFLGSHWADWVWVNFHHSKDDLLFPGDGRALSPQILKFNNLFLQELARTPFPAGIETTVIAGKTLVGAKNDPVSNYVRWLTGLVGEGDMVVPVESTRIRVDHYFEVAQEFSPGVIHKFLPSQPKIQRVVAQQLGLSHQ